MSKILIADDDLITVKNIFNSIMEKNKELKVVGISNNGIETLEYIDKFRPDLLLLDLVMPKMDGIKVLDKLISEKEKYLIAMKVIVISSYIDKLYKNNNYMEYIYSILPKPYNASQLLKIIEELDRKIYDNNIKDNIEEILRNFKFNRNSSAYKYLKDTIYLVVYEGKNSFNLEKDIYKKIAKINHKKSEMIIKWSIEKLMNDMYINTRYDKVQEYFKFMEDTKLTTKLFIREVIEKLDSNNRKSKFYN